MQWTTVQNTERINLHEESMLDEDNNSYIIVAITQITYSDLVLCFLTTWRLFTAWKVSKYGLFSGPYFLVFGLNTEIFGVSLRIQSEYRKMRTRNNFVLGHFPRSDWITKNIYNLEKFIQEYDLIINNMIKNLNIFFSNRQSLFGPPLPSPPSLINLYSFKDVKIFFICKNVWG